MEQLQISESNPKPIALNSVYCIDALEGLKQLKAGSVNLVVTSPPYSDIRKGYNGVKPVDYVDWFKPIGAEIYRVLTADGTFILNLNDKCEKGERVPYTWDLMLELRGMGFKLIDIIAWVKSKGLGSSSAKRGLNYWEPIFYFSKSNKPVWNPDEIRTPYPASSVKRAQKPIKANTSNREARQASGKVLYKQWKLHPKGAYPKNIQHFKQDRGKDHPASFSIELPRHFILAHTKPGDLVLDPFCGRGTTCLAAKNLGRQYLGFDLAQNFVTLAKTKYGL